MRKEVAFFARVVFADPLPFSAVLFCAMVQKCIQLVRKIKYNDITRRFTQRARAP